MALETGTYISDLNANNPPGTDLKSQGDDHIRLLKSTIKATFPNIEGELTPTHTELNYVTGVAAAIQTQLDNKPAKNFILNGRFNVQQDSQSAVGAADGAWIGDVWRFGFSGTTAVYNLGVGSPGSFPAVADAGELFTNAGIVRCAAADVTVAAGDLVILKQAIEGYDWRNLAQRPLKLGFWVWAIKAGIYCVALRSTGSFRSCVLEYTINAGSTWEYKELTVPASPADGTWDYTNGLGCSINWTFMCGSTYQTTAGSWNAGNFLGTSNQVNMSDSDANYFYITGVKLSAEDQLSHIGPEDFEQETARVQRRFWRGLPCQALNFPSYAVSSQGSWPVSFPVSMRATPTMSVDFTGMTLAACGTPTVSQANKDGCRLISSSTAVNNNANFSFAANNYIEADARI